MTVLRRLTAVLAILFLLTACAPATPPPVLKPGSLLFETPDGAVTANGVNYSFQGEKFFLSEYKSLSNGTIYLVSVYFGDKPKEYYWFVPGKTSADVVASASANNPLAGAENFISDPFGFFRENEPTFPITSLIAFVLVCLGIPTLMYGPLTADTQPFSFSISQDTVRTKRMELDNGSPDRPVVKVDLLFMPPQGAEATALYEEKGGRKWLVGYLTPIVQSIIINEAAKVEDYLQLQSHLVEVLTAISRGAHVAYFPRTEAELGVQFLAFLKVDIDLPTELTEGLNKVELARLEAMAQQSLRNALIQQYLEYREASGLDSLNAAQALSDLMIGSGAMNGTLSNAAAVLSRPPRTNARVAAVLAEDSTPVAEPEAE